MRAPAAGRSFILEPPGIGLDIPSCGGSIARLATALRAAVCLDAWPKGATPDMMVQVPLENAGDERSGLQIATDVSEVLGEHALQEVWLTAPSVKRMALSGGSYTSFHFTRNAQQVS